MKPSRILKFLRSGSLRVHFSQYGEDVILHKLFGSKFSDGFYIDAGAHHPFRQSNTAYLWLMGWRGINIDASRAAIQNFEKVRSSDLNVWSAIVDDSTALTNKEITLYSNSDVDLTATCDPVIAAKRGAAQSSMVPCTTLRKIINEHAVTMTEKIEFLNIDIEGFDQQAIASLSEWVLKPEVICIESYAHSVREVLSSPACNLLESNNYMLIGRVGPTAIFRREG